MEKIKQALDKARLERQQVSGEISKLESQPVSDVSLIKYTRTQSVEGSPLLMRENRLISSMEQGGYTDALKILSTQVLQRMS